MRKNKGPPSGNDEIFSWNLFTELFGLKRPKKPTLGGGGT